MYSYLVIFLVFGIFGGLFEGILYGNYTDQISQVIPIPFLVLWGIGSIFILLLYNFWKKGKKSLYELFILSLIATIVLTLGECVAGKISEQIYEKQLWNYRISKGDYDIFYKYCTFCDGYNNILASFIIFIFSFILLNILNYIMYS